MISRACGNLEGRQVIIQKKDCILLSEDLSEDLDEMQHYGITKG